MTLVSKIDEDDQNKVTVNTFTFYWGRCFSFRCMFPSFTLVFSSWTFLIFSMAMPLIPYVVLKQFT